MKPEATKRIKQGAPRSRETEGTAELEKEKEKAKGSEVRLDFGSNIGPLTSDQVLGPRLRIKYWALDSDQNKKPETTIVDT
ncbi:hypothetical protein SDJN03_28145, partial [Cucurbita argyrosperma subsp. sororia]